jgi:hypothetical protein
MEDIMKVVNTIDQWAVLASVLKEKQYRFSAMQYRFDHPEGFHTWFMAKGGKEVEVMTHDKAVQDAIIKFADEK